jgi:hypothetical protein
MKVSTMSARVDEDAEQVQIERAVLAQQGDE